MNILNGDFFKGIIDKVTLLIDSFNKLGTTSGMIALVSLVKGAKSITGSKGILGEQAGLLSLFSKKELHLLFQLYLVRVLKLRAKLPPSLPLLVELLAVLAVRAHKL